MCGLRSIPGLTAPRYASRTLLLGLDRNSMIEGIDEPRVTDWLASHIPRLKPPVRYTLIAGGHSNLTYACEDAVDRRYVLRPRHSDMCSKARTTCHANTA